MGAIPSVAFSQRHVPPRLSMLGWTSFSAERLLFYAGQARFATWLGQQVLSHSPESRSTRPSSACWPTLILRLVLGVRRSSLFRRLLRNDYMSCIASSGWPCRKSERQTIG